MERPRVIALGLFLRIVHILLFSYILFYFPLYFPLFLQLLLKIDTERKFAIKKN